MATCEKRVEGRIMAYPCTLEAGHEANGPDFDPEPCTTPEVEASVRRHTYWENREHARKTQPEESVEDIEADAEQQMAEAQVAEPEHNLLAKECMMRSENAVWGDFEVCPTCSGKQRPLVLVENDAAIRAGEIHNPFAVTCVKRTGNEISLEGERCYICSPEPPAVDVVPAEEAPKFLHEVETTDGSNFNGGMEVPVAPLDEVDRNARAYGFEIGKGHPVAAVIEQTSPDNPFMDPNWRDTVEGAEFVAASEDGDAVVPTKQREGDQVLPAGGDRPVQEWIIDQEHQSPNADSGVVVDTMQESIRVGVERYGQPLHTFDGRLNIRDLADELRDAFVYVSKMQMTAEADKQTLVRMVAEALDNLQRTGAPEDMTTEHVAEVAVDRILDWVLVQKIGTDQVVPIREG